MDSKLKVPFSGDLFSQHFLVHRLPHDTHWKKIGGDSKRAFDEIKKLYNKQASFIEKDDEAPIEEDFIRPILRALGHVFDVQAPVRSGRGIEYKPDYALFEDQEKKDIAKEFRGAKDSDAYFKIASGIAEAKRWNVPLDGGRGENPAVKIKIYLKITDVSWGILTNGKVWRIYSKKVGFSSNVYYEIDLPKLLEQEEGEGFKYFYGFFGNEAFKPDGEASFLDRVFEESIKFSKELGDDLRDNVYEALKLIAEGFIQKNPGLRTDLEYARTNTLYFLYRLLFIFYAEARGLLPLDNKIYWDYSLQSIREEIAEKKDKGDRIGPIVTYWHRLKQLFDLVDRGSKEVIRKEYDFIPPYNGGLFKKDLHPFFEENELQDDYLSRGIELLSRRGDEGYVDYSSLSIRHLGSIYEGLLEYKLKYAEKDLVIEIEKGKEVYREAKEGEKADVLKDDIYRVTDKGERKATGSYYTPDYIVKYIVENTVGSIVEERIEKTNKETKDVVDDLLSIKILDPAMGSGHFLVEATNFLAHRIIEYMQEGDQIEEIPDLNEMKRIVVERCIYGVDMNPLSVELAKVSLWLDTVSKDKALSFLDHHLQCGNSLIGASLEDIVTVLPTKKGKKKKDSNETSIQVKLFGREFSAAVREMIKKRREIETIPSDTVKDIEKKEKLLKETHVLTQRFKEILDIYTSQYFGNEAPSGDYYNAIVSINSDSRKWGLFKNKSWFQEAVTTSEDKRFFNWELSFPEIFFDEYGSVKDNPGFDSVVGNPPYVRVQFLDKTDKTYITKKFFVARGKFDVYLPFVELGLNFVKDNGLFAYIMPFKFSEVEYGSNLRILLKDKSNILFFLYFGDYPIFEGVTNYTCIPIIRKSTAEFEAFNFATLTTSDRINSFFIEKKTGYTKISKKVLEKDPWNIDSWTEPSIELNVPIVELGKIAKNICKGIDPGGATDIFVVPYSNELRKEKGLHRIILGTDIEAYELNATGLIVHPYEIDKTGDAFIPDFLALGEWGNNRLESFKKDLKNRDYVIEAGKSWFELWNQRTPSTQLVPKIVICNMSKKNRFAYDKKGEFFTIHTVYSLILNEESEKELGYLYVLALLNSSFLTFLFSKISTKVKGGYMRYSKLYLEKLSIRCVFFNTPEEERTKLVFELKRFYVESNFQEIDGIIKSYLPQKGTSVAGQEKSDVVHDFLAFLAEQMLEMKKKEHKLDGALDLFKYLSTDIQVQKFRWLFDEEIKYGRAVDENILKDFHDIDDFRIIKEGDEWIIEAELKLRDVEGLRNFLKEGSKILKEWYKLYAFDMDDEKAGYYNAIFENFSSFDNSKIPSGHKKRVKEKLFQAQIPIFDGDKIKAITPYLEIYDELSELREKIEKTDWLIDQIVYKLYGLTDDEIKVVEGKNA